MKVWIKFSDYIIKMSKEKGLIFNDFSKWIEIVNCNCNSFNVKEWWNAKINLCVISTIKYLLYICSF